MIVMKKFFVPFVFCLFVSLFFSCNSNKQGEGTEMSLADSLQQTKSELNYYNSTLAEISSCIDSIAMQEQLLLSGNSEVSGAPKSKKEILESLKQFKQMLANYRQRMTAMEDSLSNKEGSNAHLRKIISFLNTQIKEKDEEIARLQEEVLSGQRNIESLKSDVRKLSTANDVLTQSVQHLDKVASDQDALLNQGFYIVGTSAELKAANLTSKKFLGKTKVNVSGIDNSKFKKINIRSVKRIDVNGKSPKILSQMPEGSYHWEGSTLVIDDATSFWSVTSYLIIMIK